MLEESAVPFRGSGTIAVGVGFTRTTADIARIVVQPVQPLPSGDDYVIDNIYYNTSPVNPVPEPSSLLLLALGSVVFQAPAQHAAAFTSRQRQTCGNQRPLLSDSLTV